MGQRKTLVKLMSPQLTTHGFGFKPERHSCELLWLILQHDGGQDGRLLRLACGMAPVSKLRRSTYERDQRSESHGWAMGFRHLIILTIFFFVVVQR
jgi:hypothetical protein